MNDLKRFLTINGIFSMFSGMILLIFSGRLKDFFEVENNYVFPVIGLNLILFSIFIRFALYKHLKNKILVNLISGLDVLWVLGSFILILFKPFKLSKNGNILIGIVAIWIAFLAYKQIKNTNRLY